MKHCRIFITISLLILLHNIPLIAQTDCSFRTAAWHPIDEVVAVNCDNLVTIYTPQLVAIQTLIPPSEPPDTYPTITQLAWSPNGSKLAVASLRDDAPGGDAFIRRVIVWDINSSTIIFDVKRIGSPISWSPSGDYIAASSGYQAHFYEVATGIEIGECSGCGRNKINWSPVNENQLAAELGSDSTILIDPFNSSVTSIVFSGIHVFNGEIFSPNGNYIILFNDTTSALDIWNINSQQNIASLPLSIVGSFHAIWWQENGIYISSSDGVTFRWDGESQQADTLLVTASITFWSPDGSYVIAQNNGQTIYSYDGNTGEFVAGINSDGTPTSLP